MNDILGTIVDGAYRVDRYINGGGFGVVYECHDLQLDRTVALKLLKTLGTGMQLSTEARHLASLNHPNVVQIYRFGDFEGSPFIAMEYVRGVCLLDHVRANGLATNGILALMRQVATGLAAIHAIGILHRDLSPHNIMVTEQGVAKILDLGLARDERDFSRVSSQNYLRGTLSYLSPEQINGSPATYASEVFTFGLILYEALTGKHPFQAEHPMAQLYAIAHRDPQALEGLLTSCPADLARLVQSCLEKDPSRRPQGMAVVLQQLERMLALPDPIGGSAKDRDGEAPARVGARGNPYLHRVMIKHRDDFFGRTNEVRRIYARLNATPPGSISIVGDRKIGKSSLLNYVYTRPNRQRYLEHPDRMVMVFLDLQQEKGMSMESFVRTLLGIANYELRGRLDVSDCALSLDGIKDMVERLDRDGYRLTILLDEFEGVTTNANFTLEFFSFLRYLANHYNVAYLTSSARDLQVLCHTKEISDSPFFNIFSTMRLGVFQRAEAEELIRIPSERAGIPLASYTEPILAISGLFPFFIQMACSHTFEYLEEHEQGPADFKEIRRRFYDEAKLHYRYIWDSFDMHEKSTALRVATGRSMPDALKHVLAELETRHYVEPDGAKQRLFASTFDEFVKGEARQEQKPSILGRLFGART